MAAPAELLAAVGEALGERVAGAEAAGGGSINLAARLELDSGRAVFLKHRADAGPDEFRAEAAGLAWLTEPGVLRLPAPLAIGAEPHPWLALEWIEPGRLSGSGAERLGRGLARLHRAGAAWPGALPPGHPGDRLRIGPLELALPRGAGSKAARGTAAEVAAGPGAGAPESWPAVYAEHMILPLAAKARDRGAIGPDDAAAIGCLCERIETVAGPDEPPARLHGDLWGGNVHADVAGDPWLIDPAAYGGHREIDLAMLRLFGTPGGDRLFAAYAEEWPLPDGHEDRVLLWQLFPLLVHAVLFGGGYGAQAIAAARRYL